MDRENVMKIISRHTQSVEAQKPTADKCFLDEIYAYTKKHPEFFWGDMYAIMNRYTPTTPEKPVAPVLFQDYDAGLLGDYGGGNVTWWMDYIREELDRCNEHWRKQVEAYHPEKPIAPASLVEAIEKFATQYGGIPGRELIKILDNYRPIPSTDNPREDCVQKGIEEMTTEGESLPSTQGQGEKGLVVYCDSLEKALVGALYAMPCANCPLYVEDKMCVPNDEKICMMPRKIHYLGMGIVSENYPHTLTVPSKDPQTQVQQLIQWAKDNGYGLAAEWMVGMTGKTKSEEK